MDTLVLEPDHPMMEKFQIALKNHLLKQIGKLDEQIFEMVSFFLSTNVGGRGGERTLKKVFFLLW